MTQKDMEKAGVPSVYNGCYNCKIRKSCGIKGIYDKNSRYACRKWIKK